MVVVAAAVSAVLVAVAGDVAGVLTLVICLAHLLHSTFKFGMMAAYSKDSNKGRTGSNTPLFFLVEHIGALVRNNRQELGLTHIPICPAPSLTR